MKVIGKFATQFLLNLQLSKKNLIINIQDNSFERIMKKVVDNGEINEDISSKLLIVTINIILD